MIRKNEINVLIVDDDPQVLDTISSLLKEVGYSTITCENAKDAVALIKKESFDIVLTDNKMRGISGLELLEKIKEINAEIPVILMTGYANLDSAINAIRKGAFDFLTKPFIPEELIASIKKAVKYHDLIMIEKSYEIFRKFAEASEQGLEMADLEGNITYANSALCRILGVENPEDAYQTNVRNYYSEKDLPKLENEILPNVIEQGHKTFEMPLLSVSGKVTPTIQSIFLIRDEQDIPIYLANVITDISERKRIENELRNHHDRLEELVAERTNDLKERVLDLERFYEMSVGREVKMIELKSKISQLESELSGYKKKSDDNQLQA